MRARAVALFVVTSCVGAAFLGGTASAVKAPKPCTTVATAFKPNGKPMPNSGKENGGKLFKGRASKAEHDQERLTGETANVSGFTTTLIGAQLIPQVNEFQDDGYFKITVRICSRDSAAQSWSMSDWKLQTPSGNTVTPDFVVSIPTLEYAGGELAQDGKVEGDIYFKVGNPAPPGSYYALYKPDFLNETRGVWQLNV
jgi:Domain of unknown function (DUF4352)